MYQAHFKRNPFQTNFNPKAVPILIKRYPPVFPISMMHSHLPLLNECVRELLNKDSG